MIVASDIARFLVILVVAGVFVLSWVTMTRYAFTETDPAKRLRARHIVKVALSHMGVLAVLAAETSARFGRPPTLRLPFALLFSAMTLSALIDLALYHRDKGAAT